VNVVLGETILKMLARDCLERSLVRYTGNKHYPIRKVVLMIQYMTLRFQKYGSEDLWNACYKDISETSVI
jgi:hypothetical protein